MQPTRVGLVAIAALAACGAPGAAPTTARGTPGGLTTAPAPIAIVDGRPAFLPVGQPITLARLEARLPGVEIRAAEEADEGASTSTTVYTARRGGEELFQLRATADGQAIALLSESAALAHPAGLRVGDAYEALRARGEPACWHEYEWDEYVLCKDPRIAGITYAFAPEGGAAPSDSDGDGGGEIVDLAGGRRDAILAGSAIAMLVWTPPAVP